MLIVYVILVQEQDFLVWFSINLPYLAFWAVVIVVVVVVLKKKTAKRRAVGDLVSAFVTEHIVSSSFYSPLALMRAFRWAASTSLYPLGK